MTDKFKNVRIVPLSSEELKTNSGVYTIQSHTNFAFRDDEGTSSRVDPTRIKGISRPVVDLPAVHKGKKVHVTEELPFVHKNVPMKDSRGQSDFVMVEQLGKADTAFYGHSVVLPINAAPTRLSSDTSPSQTLRHNNTETEQISSSSHNKQSGEILSSRPPLTKTHAFGKTYTTTYETFNTEDESRVEFKHAHKRIGIAKTYNGAKTPSDVRNLQRTAIEDSSLQKPSVHVHGYRPNVKLDERTDVQKQTALSFTHHQNVSSEDISPTAAIPSSFTRTVSCAVRSSRPPPLAFTRSQSVRSPRLHFSKTNVSEKKRRPPLRELSFSDSDEKTIKNYGNLSGSESLPPRPSLPELKEVRNEELFSEQGGPNLSESAKESLFHLLGDLLKRGKIQQVALLFQDIRPQHHDSDVQIIASLPKSWNIPQGVATALVKAVADTGQTMVRLMVDQSLYVCLKHGPKSIMGHCDDKIMFAAPTDGGCVVVGLSTNIAPGSCSHEICELLDILNSKGW